MRDTWDFWAARCLRGKMMPEWALDCEIGVGLAGVAIVVSHETASPHYVLVNREVFIEALSSRWGKDVVLKFLMEMEGD